MVAWLVLLGLIAVEVVAIRWWLVRNFYRVFFNDWAPVFYAAILAFDILVAWLVSMSYEPGGTNGMQLLLVMGGCLLVVTVLGVLFLRRVVRLDMTDVSPDKKDGSR